MKNPEAYAKGGTRPEKSPISLDERIREEISEMAKGAYGNAINHWTYTDWTNFFLSILHRELENREKEIVEKVNKLTPAFSEDKDLVQFKTGFNACVKILQQRITDKFGRLIPP